MEGVGSGREREEKEQWSGELSPSRFGGMKMEFDLSVGASRRYRDANDAGAVESLEWLMVGCWASKTHAKRPNTHRWTLGTREEAGLHEQARSTAKARPRGVVGRVRKGEG